MKKFTFLFGLILIFASASTAQPCLPNGIEFQTQDAIDNFQIYYPNCTQIEGDVKITGVEGEITNLSGLSVLTAVDGNLIIGDEGHSVLVIDLEGLNNISSIGGNLEIYANFSLTSLSGLDGLVVIDGDLLIEGNPQLTSNTGMGNLTSILGNIEIINNSALLNLDGLIGFSTINGNLWIDDNDALVNMQGLNNIETVEGDLIISQNDNLNDLTGLENLTSINAGLYIGSYEYGGSGNLSSLEGLNNLITIGGDFHMEWNFGITDFSALNNLVSIGGLFGIEECYALTSLDGLENLNSIGDYLAIDENFSLVDISGLSNLVFLGGDLFIGNNPFTHLSALSNLTAIGGSLYLSYSHLTDLSALSNVVSIGDELKIKNNENLKSLAGIANIESGSIMNLIITENDSLSTCHVKSICDYLATPNAEVEIHNNKAGCSSQEEVEEACESADVEENTSIRKLWAYPNPTADEFYIMDNSGQPIQQIELVNHQGNPVLSISNPQSKVDISYFPKGIYYLKISQGGLQTVEKLVVQ